MTQQELESKIEVLGEFVAFRQLHDEKTSIGGIILPSNDQAREVKYGKVIAIGSGHYTQLGNEIPMTVKVGDTVLYKNFVPHVLNVPGGEPILFCQEQELLGRLKQ